MELTQDLHFTNFRIEMNSKQLHTKPIKETWIQIILICTLIRSHVQKWKKQNLFPTPCCMFLTPAQQLAFKISQC